MYKIFHKNTYIKEEDYSYLVQCSEKDASLFTENIANGIIEFLGADARKIEVDLNHEK